MATPPASTGWTWIRIQRTPPAGRRVRPRMSTTTRPLALWVDVSRPRSAALYGGVCDDVRLRAAGVKLALTNGRLRPRNVPRYRWLFRLVGNLLEKFDVLMMRADDEAERALLLGAPRDRVHVTGNTKFDALAVSVPLAEDASLRQALALETGRLWVCGSTHEGEEAGLLRVFSELRREHGDLRLLIAPVFASMS